MAAVLVRPVGGNIMRQAHHLSISFVAAAFAVCTAVATAPAVHAAQKARKAPDDSAKSEASSAQRHVESGVSALDAGRNDAAVASFTSALTAGSLPPEQTARALSLRGAAYRRQGKPAQAIADLTSALWMSNGLSATQRADALRERSIAYREAGMPDQSEADAVKAASMGAPVARPVASAPPVASIGAWPTQTSMPAPALRSGSGSPPPAPRPEEVIGEWPAGTMPAKPSGGGLFGFLLGGGSAAPAAPAAAPAPRPAPAMTAQSSAWTSTTEIRTGSLPAAAPPPEPRADVRGAKASNRIASAPVPTGIFQLQIAAVRSRADAEALAARVEQRLGASLEGRQTSIDEATIGNMGTLYRLRIGPFAQETEPPALCSRLRRDGLDCMMVVQ